MAVYQINRIIEDVRISLDLNKTSELLTSIADDETLSINEIIRSKIVEAVKRVHIVAPAHLLDQGYKFGETLVMNSDGSGYTILPDDFMRFVVFEMSDWERPCLQALSTDDPLYRQQFSKFKGIKGNYQNPLCFISIQHVGRVLEFYSSKSEDAYILRAVYLPYPKIDELDGIDICERCYDAVLHTISSMVSATLGDTEKSNYYNEMAKTTLI